MLKCIGCRINFYSFWIKYLPLPPVSWNTTPATNRCHIHIAKDRIGSGSYHHYRFRSFSSCDFPTTVTFHKLRLCRTSVLWLQPLFGASNPAPQPSSAGYYYGWTGKYVTIWCQIGEHKWQREQLSGTTSIQYIMHLLLPVKVRLLNCLLTTYLFYRKTVDIEVGTTVNIPIVSLPQRPPQILYLFGRIADLTAQITLMVRILQWEKKTLCFLERLSATTNSYAQL